MSMCRRSGRACVSRWVSKTRPTLHQLSTSLLLFDTIFARCSSTALAAALPPYDNVGRCPSVDSVVVTGSAGAAGPAAGGSFSVKAVPLPTVLSTRIRP